MSLLADRFESAPGDAMLALMMLCHGTRIGETRQSRWADIALPEREWFIPAEHTKTKTELRVPLTDQVCSLLQPYPAKRPGLRRAAPIPVTPWQGTQRPPGECGIHTVRAGRLDQSRPAQGGPYRVD